MNEERPTVGGFRPRARLLELLGEQLIGNSRLALFELVKNAYDADASRAIVRMSGLGTENASISVVDDGIGMDLATVRDIWLVPGHDHKAVSRAAGGRSAKGRLPLGEKGVGRFAVHRLGRRVALVTRAIGSVSEVVLELDWETIAKAEFLSEVEVEVRERAPVVFTGDSHGTRIKVEKLREGWTRGEVRRLARQIGSISAPLGEVADDFYAEIELDDGVRWLEGLATPADMTGQALWEFEFQIGPDARISWDYRFRGLGAARVEGRDQHVDDAALLLDPKLLHRDDDSVDDEDTAPNARPVAKRTRPKPVVAIPELLEGIGPVSGRFYVFDRDPEVVELIGDNKDLRDYLAENGGIRVYRDGVRVYNYGEPGDDWLGLDLRRVNSPTKRISKNLVLGVVKVAMESSSGLRERTSREGFVDSEQLSAFRALVLGAIEAFEAERFEDKARLRSALANERKSIQRGIEVPVDNLRALAAKHHLLEAVEPDLQRLTRSYNDLREVLVRAGVSGASLAIVYHEIDHGVRLLQRIADGSEDFDARVRDEISRLVQVLDGSGDLLRRTPPKTTSLVAVAKRASDLNAVRLTHHGVELTLELGVDRDSAHFSAVLASGLILGAVTNIIDNSIYWMNVRWGSTEPSSRRLYIGVEAGSTFDGPKLVIADNGPGLSDGLDNLIQPFFTRRPDGVGIGLYYVSLIMQSIGGHLRVAADAERLAGLGFDGTALELEFLRGEK